jgi:hypothetical protein
MNIYACGANQLIACESNSFTLKDPTKRLSYSKILIMYLLMNVTFFISFIALLFVKLL